VDLRRWLLGAGELGGEELVRMTRMSWMH